MPISHTIPLTSELTLGEGRDRYLQQNAFKSPHTIDAYRRAIDLLFEFLEDRAGSSLLPIQQQRFVSAEQIPLSALCADDAPLLHHFARWLRAPGSGNSGDTRPYKPATVELRLAGVQNWFEFLKTQGWLPAPFSLSNAKRLVRDDVGFHVSHNAPTQPPDDIESVVYYYDTQTLRKPKIDADRARRWELTRLRNTALLHVLAESGGRISEILSLNLTDFVNHKVGRNELMRVTVLGKGGHIYSLRLQSALPAVYAYIQARGAVSEKGDVPLFVSHDPRYDGQPMSRVVAWRVVQRAARALGLHDITPHDFRHWRAAQLLRAGYTLDEVQDYLGHQSVETTRAFYAPPPSE
jgi:site-specific recombinase XerD